MQLYRKTILLYTKVIKHLSFFHIVAISFSNEKGGLIFKKEKRDQILNISLLPNIEYIFIARIYIIILQ